MTPVGMTPGIVTVLPGQDCINKTQAIKVAIFQVKVHQKPTGSQELDNFMKALGTKV
jgi:hypothetical protein